MGRFLTSLITDEAPGQPDKHTLTAPLLFDSTVLGKIVTVPAGFISDYASVPRVPVVFEIFGGDIGDNPAAVVHDFLYSQGLVPRADCDAVFREALRACGMSAWRATAMYWGVRIGGESHYVMQPEAQS